MKLGRYLSIFPIIFGLLTFAALAESNQTGEITFSNHVMVSGTQLAPGDYVVRWKGSGPGVQLRFLHDGKEVASVTGKVIEQKNPRISFTTDAGEDGSRVLTEIAFSDATLVLTQSDASISQ